MSKHKGQSLAIALNMNRRKKMAKGGPVSAKTEKRPMPDQRGEETARNSSDKPAHMDSVTSRPDISQSQRGPKTTKIKHPSMAQSPVFKIRLRDEEDDMMSSDAPASPKEHIRAPMAEGGKINDFEDMSRAEEDGVMHPAGLESDNDMMGDKDAMSDHMAMLAEGGEIDAEMDMDHEDSIAAAIMARRDRLHAEIDSGSHDLDSAVKMAEGGEVDIGMNGAEEPDDFDSMNEAALKENYDDDLEDVSQPKDSNEHGHEIDEDDHDMVGKIRRGMTAKRQFKGR